MTQIVHIVGVQGSGKSMLALALIEHLAANRYRAVSLDELQFAHTHKGKLHRVLEDHAGQDVVLIEHLPRTADVDALRQSGLVIHAGPKFMDTVNAVPQAQQQVLAHVVKAG